MVLRKETPQQKGLVPAPLSQAVNNPPYPITPTSEHPPPLPSSSDQHEVYSPDLNKSPAFNLKPLEEAQRQQREESDSDYSDNEWDNSDDEQHTPDDLPGSLKVGGGKQPQKVPGHGQSESSQNGLPEALRAGPPPGIAVKKSLETISPDPTGATSSSYGAASTESGSSAPFHTNNPYLRMQNTGQSNFGGESSAQIWGDAPTAAQKYGELVELPSMQTPITPTEDVSKLTLNSNVPLQQGPASPNQPPLIAIESATPSTAHPRQESNASSGWDPGMDISSLDAFSRNHGLPDDFIDQQPQRTWQEQQTWEQNERQRKQQELEAAHHAAMIEEQERRHAEEFHRGEQAVKLAQAASPFEEQEEAAPTLPPRRSHEELPPPMPPRPIDTSGVQSRSEVESPGTALRKQRNQTYQIKQVRWYDANKQGIRASPILTQNENGPCPLLALVNALCLSTPAGVESGLVEALRSREQVSLGLLLDAVFDELMSGRRGGAAQELPDVSELYKFLLGLHTGMNVNPMFVQDPEATDGSFDLIPSLVIKAGGFVNTPEMKFYRAFNIPLIHGWLPSSGSEAYHAFERTAKTFEDAQLVQFQEEELEAKLSTSGLSADEQRLFTDVHAIKEFLNQWPTQLTDEGLKVIKQRLQPGQLGILFRNDHFSTMYKDPRTDNIVTLVTDAGYSTHDEIVWESLVDVTGQGSELFSGDFRPVGNTAPQRPQQQQVQSMLDVGSDQGWTTVQSRRRNPSQGSDHAQSAAQNGNLGSPASNLNQNEQEDHDLALALQLQEEEEDRHRRSQEERRRRENELSEAAIASHGSVRPSNRRASRPGEHPPAIPPRRNNNITTHRPNNEPAPPPTYEEAAQGPAYHPPQGHPANPNAPVNPSGPPGSAYQANSQGMPPRPGVIIGRRTSGQMGINQFGPGRPGRRHSAGVGGPNNGEDRDKCIVM